MNIEEIRAHQRAFLDQVKARKEPVSYTIEGVDIKVNPGVFPPATDTKLLAAHIHVGSGVRTLDLTTGSGIFSVLAGLQGATGVAVDINPQAVKNAAENFRRYGLRMQALESDLFQRVPEEQFDQLFVNGPFSEGDITDSLDYACYGARVFISKLFSNVKPYLKPDGKVLMVLAEWSDVEYLESTIGNNALKYDLVAKRFSDDGQRAYRLYEIRL